jgi:transcriptional regulator with XRE-family HTH domain
MVSSPEEQFGKEVRLLRRRLGLSQEALAAECGLHRTYIGSVERGERNVSLQNIVRIARALGVPPSWLLKHVK